MNLLSSNLSTFCKQIKLLINIFTVKKHLLIYRLPVVLLLSISFLFLSSCASSKKFTGDEEKEIKRESEDGVETESESESESITELTSTFSPVRVLIDDNYNDIYFTADEPLKIFNYSKPVAIIKEGNSIDISYSGDNVVITVTGKTFTSNKFRITSGTNGDYFSFNGKKYRGSLLISSDKKIINVIGLEDYLKGVLPAEMPVGTGTENYEALKAFAICARTYTLTKMNENKPDFDLYVDVRDQVYGGAGKEKEIANKAIAETQGMILSYDEMPAVIFYSACCGGYSEEGANVFAGGNKLYLISKKDGVEPDLSAGKPYCIITPKFQWEENYLPGEFIRRFIKAGLLPSSGYSIESVSVNSRFNSGRINELELHFISEPGESKYVKIYGNQIRSIIRTADDKGILRSNMFDINFDGATVTIKGKGYGHGVGLCQWGSIAQSRLGRNYREILTHYFPGTRIEKITKLKD